jgi:hypothetical protein
MTATIGKYLVTRRKLNLVAICDLAIATWRLAVCLFQPLVTGNQEWVKLDEKLSIVSII